MTISTELRKAGPFTGNGVTTAFPFSFKVFAASDVAVTRADTLGAETALVLNSDFTVALNPDQDAAPGGTITLAAPLATGHRLAVSSVVPNLQPTDITNNGGFYPRVIEDALDRHVAQIQQIDEKVDRALKVAVTSPLGDQALPSPAAGMLIGWNESNDGLKNYAPIGGTLLGQQLAAANGSSLVGFQQAGAGAVVRTAQDKMREWVSVKDFGAVGDGVTDDTAAIQAAIDYAISSGVIDIAIEDASYLVSGALANRSNVTFIGAGELVGTGAYRTRVVPADSNAIEAFSDIAPVEHLQKFMRAKNPIVVLVGDSLATPNPNALDETSTLYSALVSKIRADNPGKSISFYNRAVGGMAWSDINGVAWTNYPDWYTNQSAPWLSYVEALSPDLVVFAAGMNDGYQDAFNAGNVTSVVGKVKAWAKVPDIVFVTTPVPTMEPHANYAYFGTQAEQESRDKNAGWIRTYAKYHGYGLLDVNRASNAARDARDILKTYSKRAISSLALPSGSFVAAEAYACRDFSLRVELNSTTFSSGNTLAVRLGPATNDVVLVHTVGGNLQFDFHYGSEPPTNYQNVLTAIPAPAGAFSLQVEKRDGLFVACVSTAAGVDEAVRVKIITHGGVFRPRVGWYDNQFTSGPCVNLEWLNVGRDSRVRPSITNNALWGVPGPAADTKYPDGGNGINHPTSRGFSEIYGRVIRASRLGASNYRVSLGGNSGYEVREGKVYKAWGRWVASTTAARIDVQIAFPVAFSTYSLSLHITAGANTGTLSATTGGAQTIVTAGTPRADGVDIAVHSLAEVGVGRFVDWEVVATD